MIVICFINGTEVKAETSEDGRYGYQIFDDETKEIEITYYYGSEEEVVVPSEINGYTVSRIDLTIFRQCSNMVSLTLPETIRGFTHGGMNGCDALQEIIVEGEEGAFQTINGVLFSGEELIWYPAAKSDTEYFVPGNVYSIGVGAFTECKNLEKITLPEGIEEINIGAFEDCTNLQYVNLPDSIEELEREVFMNCSSLDNIVLPGKITELKSSTFEGCSSLNNIILPSKLVSIGMNVFSGCTSLTEINIPDQVESIGWYAFSECSSLKSVDIPASVKTIDKENPFQWCYALETINVDAQNEWYYSQDGVLFEKATKSLMIYPVGKTDTVYNVPEGTLEIGNGAFWGCSALKDINLPSTLQTIKIHAFYDCSNLTSIDIPEGITEIEDRIFAGCSSLKEIKLSNIFVISEKNSLEVQAAVSLNNPIIEEDSSMESGQNVTWDCIWFGSYPQTEVVLEGSDEEAKLEWMNDYSETKYESLSQNEFRLIENGSYNENGEAVHEFQ